MKFYSLSLFTEKLQMEMYSEQRPFYYYRIIK